MQSLLQKIIKSLVLLIFLTVSKGEIGIKTRRRGLRLKKSMKRGLASRGIAGENAVLRDFGTWRGSAGADWEQLPMEEGVGVRAAQEGAASEDSAPDPG